MQLDHVALLVRSIEAVLPKLDPIDAAIGPLQEFPKEGTRERYVGESGTAGRLLLTEPINNAGPYARALTKRGPGLHHIAYRVADIDTFLQQHSGWLLHPISLQTRTSCNTIWLARPGIPMLLEVFEAAESLQSPPLITHAQLPIPNEHEHLTDALGIRSGVPALTCAGARFEIQQLLD